MLKIYESKNDLGTYARYSKVDFSLSDQQFGTCAAQAVVFLKNFNITTPSLSRPDPFNSLILQAQAEILSKELKEEFINRITDAVGLMLIGKAVPYFNIKSALTHIALNRGQYIFIIKYHIVAIVHQHDGFYFFDSNDGLFHEKDKIDFIDDVTMHLSKYKEKNDSYISIELMSVCRIT